MEHPLGRRIQKIWPNTANNSTMVRNYLYDGANIVTELNASGAVVASYTQGAGIDEPLAMRRGGYISYYHADGLGSVTSLTNTNAQPVATYVYDSFGNTTATEGIFNPFRYTGREQDPETGLYYYRARYYDPTIGRFLSEDPIGFRGGINKYAYVGNRPLNFVDPFGKCGGPNPYITALANALGLIGLATGQPELGYVSVAISIANDPGTFGQAAGGLGVLYDVGLLAGNWITKNVMAPVLNAMPSQTIDVNGVNIPLPPSASW
jgi:RHS repeat-associated protein